MVFNTILCYVSPKIVIFQELLIVETQNNTGFSSINPYIHATQTILMHYSSTKWKFLQSVIFQDCCRDSQVPLNSACLDKYALLKPFWCIFPTQNQQNVKILPESVIYCRNCLLQRLKISAIGIQHVLNPKICTT